VEHCTLLTGGNVRARYKRGAFHISKEYTMKLPRVVLPGLLVCIIHVSCKESTTQPIVAFEGITETSTGPDPIGRIDTNDWRPMMDCVSVGGPGVSTCTKVFPAYPNPASGSFTVQYSLNGVDSVYMTLNTPANVIKELVNHRQAPGSYSVNVDASDLSPGIYRVAITAVSPTDTLHSYGDVQIVQ
jgi:hypothetical protein